MWLLANLPNKELRRNGYNQSKPGTTELIVANLEIATTDSTLLCQILQLKDSAEHGNFYQKRKPKDYCVSFGASIEHAKSYWKRKLKDHCVSFGAVVPGFKPYY